MLFALGGICVSDVIPFAATRRNKASNRIFFIKYVSRAEAHPIAFRSHMKRPWKLPLPLPFLSRTQDLSRAHRLSHLSIQSQLEEDDY